MKSIYITNVLELWRFSIAVEIDLCRCGHNDPRRAILQSVRKSRHSEGLSSLRFAASLACPSAVHCGSEISGASISATRILGPSNQSVSPSTTQLARMGPALIVLFRPSSSRPPCDWQHRRADRFRSGRYCRYRDLCRRQSARGYASRRTQGEGTKARMRSFVISI